MQNIIIDKPYQFVPPLNSRIWPKLLAAYMPRYLDKSCGFRKIECVGVEKLKASIAAGHGVLIAPNHSRPCDPMMLGILSNAARSPFFIMASWHIFMQSKLQTFLLRRAGAFSVYREGMDRAALTAAMEILEKATRPLIIFPEGIVSRTNEHLSPLMEGIAFIARGAAKKRAKLPTPGKVVIHPVAINYFFKGDIEATLKPVLEELETRLTWPKQTGVPLTERIYKVGGGLLGLKEIHYMGKTQDGTLRERIERLIDFIVDPMEKEYCNGKRESNTIARVKRMRSAILPEMVEGEMKEEERVRRWKQLADLYFVQQLDFYRPDYIRSRPSPERMLETMERFEEDLTDTARVHRPMEARIEVGDAIEVNPDRDRSGPDPVMTKMEEFLRETLKRNAEQFSKPLTFTSAS